MKHKFIFSATLALSFALAGCFEKLNENDNLTDEGGSPSSVSLNDGLLLHYSFDNETAGDLSGNDRDGILLFEEPLAFPDGTNGKAVRLRAEDGQCLSIPYHLFRGRNYWTVSMWLKNIDHGCLFQGRGNTNDYFTGGGDMPSLWAGENGAIGIKMANINDYSLQPYDYTILSYNYISGNSQWHHYVAEAYIDDANKYAFRFYVDGILYDDVRVPRSEQAINAATSIVFGGGNSTCSFALDELRIYSRVLNVKEVKALYQNDKQ